LRRKNDTPFDIFQLSAEEISITARLLLPLPELSGQGSEKGKQIKDAKNCGND
jgi:hypothetical protein